VPRRGIRGSFELVILGCIFLLTGGEDIMRERDREINRRRQRKEKAQKARTREAIENAKKAAAAKKK
jgi:hypothetical protein